MLKDLFDKGKCALGFHIGDWRYLQDRSCQQTRVCSRCKAASQQLLHAWQNWDYESTDACRMARHCGRCAETDEICRATHVVVDLTDLNANVALELGMAHTLGRNILLISQDQQVERYFRAIAKHRIHPYTVGTRSDAPTLQATLQRFLA